MLVQVAIYERELRLLRSCLLAKKALAFNSISFSPLSLASSRFSLRFSSRIWNGLMSASSGCAPPAVLAQCDREPASQPDSLAISAYVASGPAAL